MNVRRRGHGKTVTPARRESPTDAIENEKSLFQDWSVEIVHANVKPVCFERSPSRKSKDPSPPRDVILQKRDSLFSEPNVTFVNILNREIKIKVFGNLGSVRAGRRTNRRLRTGVAEGPGVVFLRIEGRGWEIGAEEGAGT